MNPWEMRAKAEELEKGVKIVVAEYPGWTFKIRRDCPWNAHNARAIARITSLPKYAALMAKARDGKPLTSAELDLDHEMTVSVFVEGIVSDWTGVQDADGKPMAFNAKNARKVMLAFPDIYTALRRESRNAANFTALPDEVKAELASGNSEAA